MNQNTPFRTAAVLIIGNEILCGQTQDINLSYIAKRLESQGILVQEARVIPDIEEKIIEAVNYCRHHYEYVFTTGGIGPTHDDITAQAIAKAFGRPLITNKEIEQLFRSRTTPDTEAYLEARLRMAQTPEDALLIPNSLSLAPGFQVENVFVLAGVPSIMQAMLDTLLPRLQGGRPPLKKALFLSVLEGVIAEELRVIQAQHPTLEIGSYPSWKEDQEKGVKITLKGTEEKEIQEAVKKLLSLAEQHNVTPRIQEI